jgi:hypothetical protein
MRTLKTVVASLLTVVGSTGLLMAAEQPDARLEALRRARDLQFGGEKGSARFTEIQQRRAVDRLIQDIEAGKAVDPQEIDRLLR